ncbi:cache domain-containing protein [Aureivirga sp. CE67]|uniref:cache domain-containing protein n=1 Tax=Aureivirga sp. CE67 TaxID=1788983 RepID=UPI0018C968A0|nr:cache domain-containing protein [Aureivirga sp. CE67]
MKKFLLIIAVLFVFGCDHDDDDFHFFEICPNYQNCLSEETVVFIENYLNESIAYAESHTKSEAVDYFNANNYNEEYYVFVDELDGTMIANAVRPQDVGKNFYNYVDTETGRNPVQDIIKTATFSYPESGWVTYFYFEPLTNEIEQKFALVRLIKDAEDGDYIIGTGAYVRK